MITSGSYAQAIAGAWQNPGGLYEDSLEPSADESAAARRSAMKAIIMDRFGGPEVLEYRDVPTPVPARGEVLIRVRAVTVNRTLDLAVRRDGDNRGVTLPLVLGTDPSGTIEAAGDGVSTLHVGDHVAVTGSVRCGVCPQCSAGREEDCSKPGHVGVHRWGGYAEYVVVPERNTVRLPDDLPFPEASVIVRHAPTAWNLLQNKAELQSGETVLVMGASGALGSMGVQVAQILGARVVAGAGTDAGCALARELGAEHAINYRTTALDEAIAAYTGGRGVDVVFENISDPELWPRAFASLAPSGRLVTAGAHGGGIVALDCRRLYQRRLKVIGGAGSTPANVKSALAAAVEGKLRAVIDRVLPLAQAAEAHQIVGRRDVLGKVVLTPAA
jgi:NADPH:quinone reductase